jgi:hypothetical protein
MSDGGAIKQGFECQLDQLLVGCCRELFSAYRVDVEPGSPGEVLCPDKLSLAGVMGFGGKHARGAVVLAATDEPLAASNPRGGASQRDWICELANQLTGRIKIRLLALGIEILLATPAGLSGNSLAPIAVRPRGLQVFLAGTGFICAWIDCEFVDGVELPESPPEGVEIGISEGELLLF